MAGFRIIHRDGTHVLHPTIWVDPVEVPVSFILVKDGTLALAHPDYIADLLQQMDSGDLDPALAWDDLMVFDQNMPYPQKCRVRRLLGTDGAAEILIGNKIIHRFE
jgi:hypothetical protein